MTYPRFVNFIVRTLANFPDYLLPARGMLAPHLGTLVFEQAADRLRAAATPIGQFEAAMASERTREGLAAARARGRTGGQKPKLGPRQAKLAQQMYDELDEDGKRRYTVAHIAAEFGVTRPTIYCHLQRSADVSS